MKKKSLKEIAEIMEAPTFYPSEEDFKDPLEYFEIVKPIAQKYGICRVVPPSSFKVSLYIHIYIFYQFEINDYSRRHQGRYRFFRGEGGGPKFE